MGAEVLAPTAFELGEGARSIGGRLYVVDIVGGAAYRWQGGALVPVVRSALPLGAVAGIADDPDALIVVEGLGVSWASPGAKPEPVGTQRLVELEPAGAASTMRVNDAAVDPQGALWVGTMSTVGESTGSVFRVRADLSVERVLADIECPNGPAFGADGTVYLADTTGRTILRSRLHDDGSLDRFTPFLQVDGGLPDGMTVDADGVLWYAVWGAGEVRRVDPDGRDAGRLEVGARQPTSVCLLEVDGRRSAVVTTARTGLAEPAAGDGAVWVAECDAAGLPSTPMRLDRDESGGLPECL